MLDEVQRLLDANVYLMNEKKIDKNKDEDTGKKCIRVFN